MQIYDMPASKLVLTTADQDELARGLEGILALSRATAFLHSEPVYGCQMSVRILSPVAEELPGLPGPMTARLAAAEWFRYVEEEGGARYPSPPKVPVFQKGCMLRSFAFKECRAAIIWAHWIEPQS